MFKQFMIVIAVLACACGGDAGDDGATDAGDDPRFGRDGRGDDGTIGLRDAGELGQDAGEALDAGELGQDAGEALDAGELGQDAGELDAGDAAPPDASALNACGGRSELEHEPNAICTLPAGFSCPLGYPRWACAGREAVECSCPTN